jgi:hypothetical protein
MARQQSYGRRESIMGLLRGQTQQTQSAWFPAPTGGINRTDSIGALPPTEAILMNNMTSSSNGITVRPGYTNHVTQIGDSIDTEVRTLHAFNDVSRDKSQPRDRLFAFTDQGIYDVTNAQSNPPLMNIYDGVGGATILSNGWPVKGGDAGWCSCINFTTAAQQNGKHYLIACDIINGYHVYDPDGGGAGIGRWYKVTQGNSGQTIEGIDPTKFSHVCSWKGRLIFSETDASRAWYLTPGTITGTGASKPVAIDMGSRFVFGGFLKGCFSWTYDGGAGIDDFLVAISSSGDVVVWQGISPTDASFQIKGVWYVGSVPRGRRIADDYGGDLLILGSLGLVPISALVQGGREGDSKYLTYKVQDLVRRLFREQGNKWGWNICSVPTFGGYVIITPRLLDGTDVNLYYSFTTQAWSTVTKIPAFDFFEFRNIQYFSTYDGRVCILGGGVDTNQDGPGVFSEDPVGWQMLSGFQSFEAPANWKAAQLIRPVFLATRLPTYNVAARYDFDIALPDVVDPPPLVGGALWDLALWDIGLWGGGYITEQPTIGTVGMGRWVAVALSGRSSVQTNLLGFNVLFKPGGML